VSRGVGKLDGAVGFVGPAVRCHVWASVVSPALCIFHVAFVGLRWYCALWVGGGLALALLAGLTSRSKGRAARWRFWGLVFYQGSAASFTLSERRAPYLYVRHSPTSSHLTQKELIMQPGDHLVTPRLGYSHHGIYIGNGEVIHYSGFSNGMSKGEISITSIDEFGNGNNIHIKEYLVRTYNPDESVERAFSRLGEDWYNVLINNCEHFATWCVIGFHSSSQVNQLIFSVTLSKSALEAIAAKTLQTETTRTAAALISSEISGVAGRYISKSATSIAAKSIISSSTGTVAGIATSAGIASGAGVTTAVVAGITATTAAPIVAVVAVGAGVGYAVKKIIDWFWD